VRMSKIENRCGLRLVSAGLLSCVVVAAIPIPARPNGDEQDRQQKEWYEKAFRDSAPPELMRFLPDSLKVVHGRTFGDAPEWYESEWSLGRPKFYITDIDTMVTGSDTVLAILFTDGQVSQPGTVSLRSGVLSALPNVGGAFYTGLLCHFWEPALDLDADGRPDVIVVFPAGAHATNIRPYLWKGMHMLALPELSSDMSSFEFKDLDGDRSLEVVAKSRSGARGVNTLIRTYKIASETLMLVDSSRVEVGK